jgi:hypothetical protein
MRSTPESAATLRHHPHPAPQETCSRQACYALPHAGMPANESCNHAPWENCNRGCAGVVVETPLARLDCDTVRQWRALGVTCQRMRCSVQRRSIVVCPVADGAFHADRMARLTCALEVGQSHGTGPLVNTFRRRVHCGRTSRRRLFWSAATAQRTIRDQRAIRHQSLLQAPPRTDFAR